MEPVKVTKKPKAQICNHWNAAEPCPDCLCYPLIADQDFTCTFSNKDVKGGEIDHFFFRMTARVTQVSPHIMNKTWFVRTHPRQEDPNDSGAFKPRGGYEKIFSRSGQGVSSSGKIEVTMRYDVELDSAPPYSIRITEGQLVGKCQLMDNSTSDHGGSTLVNYTGWTELKITADGEKTARLSLRGRMLAQSDVVFVSFLNRRLTVSDGTARVQGAGNYLTVSLVTVVAGKEEEKRDKASKFEQVELMPHCSVGRAFVIHSKKTATAASKKQPQPEKV